VPIVIAPELAMRNAAILLIFPMAFGCLSASQAHTVSAARLIDLEQRGSITPVSHRYNGDDDDIVFEDGDFDERQPPRDDPYPPPADAAPVIEFLPPPRPANCGEFRYWNGAYCADARVEPPYTGPRW
jgi:hypothetical protein